MLIERMLASLALGGPDCYCSGQGARCGFPEKGGFLVLEAVFRRSIMSVKPLAALICLVLLFPVRGWSKEEKEKIHHKVASALLEDILRELDIRYKKATEKGGGVVYDFERNGYKIRLSNLGGEDLMLDALFTPVSVERINAWNVRASFSRGVLYPGDGKPYAAVENNLDCVGGVTSGAIKQFIRRFDAEVKAFDEFLGDSGTAALRASAKSSVEAVYPGVTSELLEEVLKGLKLNYKKNALNNGAAFLYEFQQNNVPIRLHNWGGKDLMLAAHFRKTTLKEANEFNLKRKFIRAVFYQDGAPAYTALERNLDVEGGVTENILRNFITSYAADVKEFERFLGK
jgi:hypothetical protein